MDWRNCDTSGRAIFCPYWGLNQYLPECSRYGVTEARQWLPVVIGVKLWGCFVGRHLAFCWCNLSIARTVWGVVLRSLAYWDCEFEFSREQGFLLSCVLPVVRQGSLRRADPLFRGILPSVVCPVGMVANPRKGWLWPGIGSKRHKKKVNISWA